VTHAVVSVLVIFVLVRRTDKAVLGEYYTVFALMLAVQLIMEAGLSTILTSRIVRSPGSWGRILEEATGLLLLEIIGSLALLIGVGFFWAYWSGNSAVLLSCAAAGCAAAALQVQRHCAGVFRAFDRFGHENIARVVQGATFAVAVVAVFDGSHGAWVVLTMLAISHVVAAVLLAYSTQRHTPCRRLRFSRSILKDWLSESVPLGMGDVARRLTWQLDTLLLGLLQPAAVVGIYSVAYRPLGLLNWLPRAVSTATFSSFTRLASENRTELNDTFSRSLRLLLVISLPIVLSIFFMAAPLIMTLGGEEYADSILMLRLLIWITCLSFLSMQFRFVMTAIGKQRVFARLVFAVFAIEVGVETMLIPYWGGFGACAGSLLGEFTFVVAGLLILRRTGVVMNEWGAVAKASVAGAVMGAMLWSVQGASVTLLITVTVSATVVYGVLCCLLGAVRREEAALVARLYRFRRAASR